MRWAVLYIGKLTPQPLRLPTRPTPCLATLHKQAAPLPHLGIQYHNDDKMAQITLNSSEVRGP